MRFHHRFRVRAAQEAVAEFHSHSASMAEITPPPIVVQVHSAPERLANGGRMDFTLWLGPLPVRWLVQFEQVGPSGFVDRMVEGPLRTWRHHHQFVAVDANTTDVVDEIDVELRSHPFWGPLGLSFWLGLPILFAYRAWRTRRLLERADEPLAAGSRLGKPAAVLVGAAGLLLGLWLLTRKADRTP